MKTAYCFNCDAPQSFETMSSRETATVRGITFSYVEKRAFCSVCREEVYVPEINDENVQAREDAYRAKVGLITVDEIRKIMEKYNIGAEPLSLVLGFGKVTVQRYLGGQLPSKEYSDELLHILSSRKEMMRCLEKGKENISDTAYKKCREKLEELNALYKDNKIELVTRYLLFRSGEITPLALQKLLYYAQAFYHALFHTDLFLEECQAWAYGPVFPDIYHKYRSFGSDPITEPTTDFQDEIDGLNIQEIELLDAVLQAFGNYSGHVLRDITHREKPWIEARGTLLPGDRSVTPLSHYTINAYFESVVQKYSILNPCDIVKYSCDMFRKVR